MDVGGSGMLPKRGSFHSDCSPCLAEHGSLDWITNLGLLIRILKCITFSWILHLAVGVCMFFNTGLHRKEFVFGDELSLDWCLCTALLRNHLANHPSDIIFMYDLANQVLDQAFDGIIHSVFSPSSCS